MPRNSLHNLVTQRLGNRRTRQDLLQVMSFPGLSVDNVATTPPAGLSVSDLMAGSGSNGASADVGQQVADLSKALGDVKTAQQSQLDALQKNTLALAQSSTTRPAGTGSTSGNAMTSLLKGAFGLSPIFTGLMDLFGSRSTPVQPLTPFTLSPSIQYAGGVNGTGAVTPVDYGQNGLSRQLTSQGQVSNSNPGQSSTVQIHVNAMDSQSFLDHSEDIAQAVRKAMLQGSSLNDVIAEI